MASLAHYGQLVMNLINDYASIPAGNEPDVYNEVLFDIANNRYLLLSLGWSKGKRVHYTVIHIDIINQKVWIQVNNTDRLIAGELVEAGIPARDIVLGLQPPEVRPYTAYGSDCENQRSEPLSA